MTTKTLFATAATARFARSHENAHNWDLRLRSPRRRRRRRGALGIAARSGKLTDGPLSKAGPHPIGGGSGPAPSLLLLPELEATPHAIDCGLAGGATCKVAAQVSDACKRRWCVAVPAHVG